MPDPQSKRSNFTAPGSLSESSHNSPDREKKDKNKLKLIGLTVLAVVLLASVVAAFWNWVNLQKKPLVLQRFSIE